MYFAGNDANGAPMSIGLARSADGIVWTALAGPVLPRGDPGSWDAEDVRYPSVILRNGNWEMYYTGGDAPSPTIIAIGRATSPDGVTWTKDPVPVLTKGPAGAWDELAVAWPAAVHDPILGKYLLYYGGQSSALPAQDRIGLATSADGLTWTKYPGVVLDRGPPGTWDGYIVQPSAVVRDGAVLLLFYTGYAGPGEFGRVGVAASLDGVNWTKSALNPLLDWGAAGRWDTTEVERPAVVGVGGEYWLFYHSRPGLIGLATSGLLGIGTVESSVLDTGGAASTWTSLSWNSTLPPNTLVSLAYRTSDDNASWSSWSQEYVSVNSGDPVVNLSARSRYFQWRATLASLDAVNTPVLHDVSVAYEQNEVTSPIAVNPPFNSCVSTSTPTLEWSYFDPEGDPQAAFHLQADDDPAFATPAVDANVTSANASYGSPPLADGSYYWQVTTSDVFGLWSNWSAASQFRVDTTPPSTAETVGSPSVAVGPTTYLLPTTLVALAAADLGCGAVSVTTEYRLLLGGYWTDWQAYAGPFTLPALEGDIPVEFRSMDGVGNAASGSRVLTIDLTPPATALSFGAPMQFVAGNPYVLPTTPITLAASDSGSGANGTWYQVDLDPFVPYTGSFDLAGYQGFHSVRFYSTDALGNADLIQSLGIYVDAAPPATALSIGQPTVYLNGTWRVTSATPLTLTAWEDAPLPATLEYQVDGGGWTLYAAPFTLAGDGAHVLDYRATDALGNVEAVQSLSLVVDDAPPTASLDIGSPLHVAGGVSFISPATPLAVRAADPSGVGSLTYSIDGGAAVPFTTPFLLTAGTHTVSFQAVDGLGNGVAGAPVSLDVDATPPSTAATVQGASVLLGGVTHVVPTGTVTLTATDTGSGVSVTEYTLGAGWTPYTGPIPLAGLSGAASMTFRSTDWVTNGERAQTLALFVDGTAPTASLILGQPAYTASGTTYLSPSTPLSLAAEDPSGVASLRYSVDGGPMADSAGPFTLAEGIHSVTYEATDALGNALAPQTTPLVVDGTPPVTSLRLAGTNVSHRGILYVTPDASFTLTAYDGASGVDTTAYDLGSGWIPHTTPVTFSGRAGLVTIAYGSVDHVGNVEAAGTFTVFVDTQAPVPVARDLTVDQFETAVLDASGSTDDGVIVNTTWSFLEGGQTVLLYGPVATHVFSLPGEYDTVLTVSDGVGRTATAIVTVTVTAVPDADGDGLPDAWELAEFGDLAAGPGDDPDGDGLSNLEEYAGGTPPKVSNAVEFWWILLIVVAACAGLAVGFLLGRRRKGGEEPSAPPEEDAMPGASSTPPVESSPEERPGGDAEASAPTVAREKEKLDRLSTMRDKGLLTDEEFEEARGDIEGDGGRSA